jgi:hypothetical protein
VVGSRHHGRDRFEQGIHHDLDQRLMDCSNHSAQIVRIHDGGDHLAGSQVQGRLVCQKLVACDDRHRHRNCQRQHFDLVPLGQMEVCHRWPMVEGWGLELVNVEGQ